MLKVRSRVEHIHEINRPFERPSPGGVDVAVNYGRRHSGAVLARPDGKGFEVEGSSTLSAPARRGCADSGTASKIAVIESPWSVGDCPPDAPAVSSIEID
jgi:hypothetical protein